MQDTDGDFAAKLAEKDPKSGVNMFLHRFLSRPVNKVDVSYLTEQYTSGFQSTVTLNCLDGQAFAGEVGATQKEAEYSAAQQILDYYADRISSMPKHRKRDRNAGSATIGGMPLGKIPRLEADPEGAPLPSNPANSAKTKLNSVCSKMVHGLMRKDDVVYDTQRVNGGGYQCYATMPRVTNQWKGVTWAGQVSKKKIDAEQSAAEAVLESLLADPEVVALVKAPKPSRDFHVVKMAKAEAFRKNWAPRMPDGKPVYSYTGY